MFPIVDTKDPTAVASFVVGQFVHGHQGASPAWLERVFHDIHELFTGGRPDYAAIDLRYHDLEHTLQATLCLSLLLEGRHRAAAEPRLGARHTELALAAALLHDTGYLKLRSDSGGTGAKYTYCHVPRSCAFATAYLPASGATAEEVEIVVNAINCTGPAKAGGPMKFRDDIGCVIGCSLGTADYLGQMAAPDYPDELEFLYHEFLEADEFTQIPIARRLFKSASDLVERTPDFWRNVVRRKLESDFQGMYRFLADPFPHGQNQYIDAVEKNIATITRRLARVAAVATNGPEELARGRPA